MNIKDLIKDFLEVFKDDVLEVKEEKFPCFFISAPLIRKAAQFLKDKGFNLLSAITGVDAPPENIFVIYHFYSINDNLLIHLKVKLQREKPEVDSISSIFPTALWHERETYDLVGVRFKGHPDLRRILLPEDWEGHPLRKDYTQPGEYHGIKTD